jgi:hypothetical protein
MIFIFLYLVYVIITFIKKKLKNNNINNNNNTTNINTINNNCNNLNFLPNIWNQLKNNIKKYNNCYAYAMRNLLYNRKSKPQPGDNCTNKLNLKVNKNYSCNNIIHNIKCDYPYDILELNNNNDKCPCNYYKVALFIDNSNPNKDYHFYRQDNKYWSHKPGNTTVTNLDASNQIINNPYTADRNYKNSKNKNNYTIPCKSFCKKKNTNIYLDT